MASGNTGLLNSGASASVILHITVQSTKHHPPFVINAVRWNLIRFTSIYFGKLFGYFTVVYKSKSKRFFYPVLRLYMLK